MIKISFVIQLVLETLLKEYMIAAIDKALLRQIQLV